MNWFEKPASKTWYNIFIIWIVITIGVSQTYFPPYGDWERKQAAEVGMSESKLNRAIQFAIKARVLDLEILKNISRPP